MRNKGIEISNKTKFFILAPAAVSTGGPECLHELGYELKKIFKLDVTMIYLPLNLKNPVHKNYKHFNLKYSNYLEDNKNNILIIPEQFSFLNHSLRFKRIKKIIWWLSIDNYFGFKFRSNYSKYVRSLIKIPYNIISLFNKLFKFKFGIFTIQDYLKIFYKFINFDKEKETNQASAHFTQSHYAYEYLKNKFKNVYQLYDYQSDKIISKSKEKKIKKDIICYSHKSNEFIEFLKEKIDVDFIPLINFNFDQINNVFKKSKIYIDFGYHPGKDKMPREATLFDNCIITNLKGSAKNNIDIPIKKKFKFKEKYENLEKIEALIFEILKNHKFYLKSFKTYKRKILNEKKVFKNQIKKIFYLK